MSPDTGAGAEAAADADGREAAPVAAAETSDPSEFPCGRNIAPPTPTSATPATPPSTPARRRVSARRPRARPPATRAERSASKPPPVSCSAAESRSSKGS
ncbi:hypothetical protein GCM10023238_34810 [Streptomyces heliomycini]